MFDNASRCTFNFTCPPPPSPPSASHLCRLSLRPPSHTPAQPASITRHLFAGDLEKSQAFPFPSLDAESKETLEMMVPAVSRFFAERVDDLAIDEEASIPDELMEEIKGLGLCGIQVPAEYDGLGLNSTSYARIVEELSNASIAVTLGAHQSIGMKGILIAGNEEQKARFLPQLATGEHMAAFCLTEATSGSDAASIRTRAVLDDSGSFYKLTGTKIWITNGGFANIFTVFARTEVDGKDKITAFVVERTASGITTGKPEKKMGIKGSNTTEVSFDETPVPVENILGEVGGGFKVAMNILNSGRFSIGAGSAGTLKRLIPSLAEHCNSRTQFGQPIGTFGLIQDLLASIAVDAYALESMTYLTTSLMDNNPGMDCSIEAACCKVAGSEFGFRGLNNGLQILGGMGYMKENGIEGQVRDARILSIFEGTNQILRLYIALTGIKYAGDRLKSVTKAPLNNLGGMFRIFFPKTPSLGGLHPSLNDECAVPITRNTRDYGAVVTSLLRKHGKSIIDRQFECKRLADAMIDLYSMIAVTSRANDALVASEASADHELRLARTWCRQADRRIQDNLMQIMYGPDANGDEDMKQIALDVLGREEYIPLHPLGV